jgi:hypothetical protein
MVAIILSALVAGLGAIGVFWPDTFLEVAHRLSTPTGLLLSAAFRVVFGASLLLAAGESRAPGLLRLFGAVILVAGLATPFLGVDFAQRFLAAAAANGGAWLRIGGTIAIALGASFVVALSPRMSMPSRR